MGSTETDESGGTGRRYRKMTKRCFGEVCRSFALSCSARLSADNSLCLILKRLIKIMKIEHLAFNVTDPLNMARWYVEHLGFTVKRRMLESPFAHFIADESGTVMLEIYGNPGAPKLDFPSVQPPALHLAFVSHDVAAEVRRLAAAGATIVADVHELPPGDTFAMLRDPWGLPLQFVKRKTSMI